MDLDNRYLGKKIKEIRLSLGKNQEEFGQLFEPPAPKSAVSRWEHGGSPNKKRLKKIAELGGVSVSDLQGVNNNRIKEVRLAKHKTQKDLANLLGVSEQTISYYEKALKEPSLVSWVKIAEYLGVPVSYLQGLSDINYKDNEQLLERAKRNPLFAEFLESLPKKKRKTIQPPISASYLSYSIRDNLLSASYSIFNELLGLTNKGRPRYTTVISDFLLNRLKTAIETTNEEEVEAISHYLQLALILMLLKDDFKSENKGFSQLLNKFERELSARDEINRR